MPSRARTCACLPMPADPTSRTHPARFVADPYSLITTADANAARAVFADFRASALALGSTETDLGEKVGDDSRVLVFQQPTSDGDLVTMTWWMLS